MHLLMLNSTPRGTFGGVERWMVRAGSGLIARGHSVHVMALPGSRLLERLAEAGVPGHGLKFGFDGSPLAAGRVARLARRERLHIAITNYNKEIRLAGMARRWSPLRTVVARSVLPMMDTSPKYQRLYARTLDGMITPSREVKRVVEEYPWMQGVRVQNIPNGIDLAALDRRREALGGRDGARRGLGLPADAFVVGVVGRLAEHKGIQHLIDAFGRLSALHRDVRLLIVGDGEYQETLRTRAEAQGEAARRITFAGYQQDVLPSLFSLDVLVLPSTTPYETFGQALVEAMGGYVPVIGSQVGGIPEIVTHDRNGLLVPPGDSEALAASIDLLHRDADLRRRLARAGRKTVEEHFREETMLDRLESYLEGLTRGG